MSPNTKKIRLDELLLAKGLCESLSKAKALIMSGNVIVNDHRIDKPALAFLPDAIIRIKSVGHDFVSRGGLKLEHALKNWPLGLKDFVAIDVGASTGGFTEVLLIHHAKKVYAIDVGHSQLAYKLTLDQRVINLERTHILKVEKDIFPEDIDVAVIDVSFISLEKVLAKVFMLLKNGGKIYALIKPQFEVADENIGLGGIVTDENIQLLVVEKIKSLSLSLGFSVIGTDKSPILGAKGNQEYLICLVKE